MTALSSSCHLVGLWEPLAPTLSFLKKVKKYDVNSMMLCVFTFMVFYAASIPDI